MHCCIREDHVLIQMSSVPSPDFSNLQHTDQVKLIGLEYSRKAADYRQDLNLILVF